MKTNALIIMVFVISIFVTFSGLQAAKPVTLTLGMSDTDAFSYKWKVKGKYVGPFIDIINEVSKRTGYKINLKPLPIKRLIMYIKSGEIDGAIGFRQIESRKKIALFLNTPIARYRANLFVHIDNNFSCEKVEDLHGKSLGMIAGLVVSQKIKDSVDRKKIKAHYLSSYKALAKMLVHKRIMFAGAVTTTFEYHIKKHGLQNQIKMLPLLLSSGSVHIMMSRKAILTKKLETTIGILNKTLSKMEEDNYISQIYKRYQYPNPTLP
jgi:polar amino acid transport system substrate-binding protein